MPEVSSWLQGEWLIPTFLIRFDCVSSFSPSLPLSRIVWYHLISSHLIAALQALSLCHSLHTLRLGFNPDVTNQGLAALAAGCPALTDLDIYR